jgi:TetR/AcrR family transcriptional repressor of bet genes
MSESKTQKKTDKNNKQRVMSKEDRRSQLIKATIKCIAKNGLSGTTMAHVTKEAGLSLGIVNLHFKSKEKLLIETLRHVTDEYNLGQKKIFDSNLNSSEKMKALVDFNFNAKITHKNKLAVWFSFFGESKARPTYKQICNHSDVDTEGAMIKLFEQVINEEAYQDLDVELIATGYTALADGLWLDLLLVTKDITREKAHKITTNYLSSFFPRHFK